MHQKFSVGKELKARNLFWLKTNVTALDQFESEMNLPDVASG